MKALKRGESRLYLLQVPQSVRRSPLSGVSRRFEMVSALLLRAFQRVLRLNLEGRLAELVTSGDQRGVHLAG